MCPSLNIKFGRGRTSMAMIFCVTKFVHLMHLFEATDQHFLELEFTLDSCIEFDKNLLSLLLFVKELKAKEFMSSYKQYCL